MTVDGAMNANETKRRPPSVRQRAVTSFVRRGHPVPVELASICIRPLASRCAVRPCVKRISGGLSVWRGKPRSDIFLPRQNPAIRVRCPLSDRITVSSDFTASTFFHTVAESNKQISLDYVRQEHKPARCRFLLPLS